MLILKNCHMKLRNDDTLIQINDDGTADINLTGYMIHPVEDYASIFGELHPKDDGRLPNSTTCSHCQANIKCGEPDPCLGYLPGVKFACCGHGSGGGYITFDNGVTIRGKFYVEQNVPKSIIVTGNTCIGEGGIH